MIFQKTIYGGMTVFDVLLSVAVLILALIISKGIAIYIKRALREKVRKDHLEIIAKLIYYAIVIIAVLSILSILGVSLSGLLVAGGIAGIVLGFASQSIFGI